MKMRRLLNARVMAVVENELAQLIRNRVVIATTLIPSFLLVALAVAVLMLSTYVDFAVVTNNRMVNSMLLSAPPSLRSGADAIRAALLSPFLLLFQIIPLVVPITIASYSIVGEKQNRSLEALLSTPIRTWELLLAKALAAALPGIVATWFSFAIFLFAGRFTLSDELYRHLILSPTWLLGITILSPLFTLLAVGLGIVISSRVQDPHSAQQLGSLIILPVVGMIIAQIMGAIELSAQLVLQIAFGVLLLDVAIMAVAIRLFRREVIVTNWR